MDPVSVRATMGAALLDEVWPGWADEIDLDSLDMGMLNDCILGQLYGHYEDGCDELGFPVCFGEWASGPRTYGFLAHQDEDHNWNAEADVEWTRQVLKRRSAA